MYCQEQQRHLNSKPKEASLEKKKHKHPCKKSQEKSNKKAGDEISQPKPEESMSNSQTTTPKTDLANRIEEKKGHK